MANNLAPLSNLANIIGGYAFKSNKFKPTGVPVVKIANISPPRVDLQSCDCISEEDTIGLDRFKLSAGDIVMAMTGATIGKVGRYRSEKTAYLNQRVAKISAKPGVADNEFINALLSQRTFEGDVLSQSSGSAQANISADGIGRILVPFFPIEEQRRIGSIVSTLDDKIELNRRQNETLETLARSLFQSWFVDFDPVRAKANGEAETAICQRLGLSPQVLVLFPTALEESPLGEMPAGWKAKSISNLAEANAWTLGKNDTLPALDYIEISEVFNGDVGNITTYKRGDEPSRARRRLRHGDTILSTVRPDRGAYFLAINPSERLIASTGFAIFSPTAAPWSFVYTALTMPDVFEFLGKRADGAAYPVVHPAVIGTWPVKYPDNPELIMAFHDAVAPLLLRAEFNRQESRALVTLRDELLPVLLSGELTAN